MSIDLEKLREFTYEQYMPKISRVYGRPGVQILRNVMGMLRRIYEHIEPDLISDSLIVFRLINEDTPPVYLSQPERVTFLEHLVQEYSPSTRSGTSAIQILSNGDLLLWKNVTIDLAKLSADAIVYLYRSRQDYFVIQGDEEKIFNPSRVHASIFAISTFQELVDALEDYKRRSIRTSTCQNFANVWHGGQGNHRLFFVNKPEDIMRKSLTQYLQNVLREAHVQPEVNVDESHPVDIQVTWANRIALIEIKWMGDSITPTGNFTSYRDARANEGAEQLAEYLDAKRTWSPVHEVIGYLVVIDARRRGITPTSTNIDRTNGFWYADKEVTYNPEYHKIRPDFKEPVRMFAEPICRPD